MSTSASPPLPLEDYDADDAASEISSTETMDYSYYPEVPMRISQPWVYETSFALDTPPDINYRRTILTDDANIEDLFKTHQIPFQERYLRYAMQDKQVERETLTLFEDWLKAMTSSALKSHEPERLEFFTELYNEVKLDDRAVAADYKEASNLFWDTKRLRVAKELGIPPNHEVWTDEDKKAYRQSYDPDGTQYNYNLVREWPLQRRDWTAASPITIPVHGIDPEVDSREEANMFRGNGAQPEEKVSDDRDEEQPERKRPRLEGKWHGPGGSADADKNAEAPEVYRLRRVKSTCVQS